MNTTEKIVLQLATDPNNNEPIQKSNLLLHHVFAKYIEVVHNLIEENDLRKNSEHRTHLFRLDLDIILSINRDLKISQIYFYFGSVEAHFGISGQTLRINTLKQFQLIREFSELIKDIVTRANIPYTYGQTHILDEEALVDFVTKKAKTLAKDSLIFSIIEEVYKYKFQQALLGKE